MANYNSVSVLWIDSDLENANTLIDKIKTKNINLTLVHPEELSRELEINHDLAVISLNENISDLAKLKAIQASQGAVIPIIARVCRHNFELGIEAMGNGAKTVIPIELEDTDELTGKIKSLISSKAESNNSSSYVFADPASRKLLALTERVAGAEVAVLLNGSTGTGKEVLAKVIHEASSRHSGPFIAFNCAALPESLAEDMLFGHEKGSFTGASSSKPGLFEQAQNGTIFLDEIGEMPMQLQVKLLRILQERKVTRLGSLSSVDLNIRIVAATNKDLKQAILKGIFREDLYFRLSAFKLTIPPLSDRPLDIIPLAEQFLKSEMGNGKLYSLSQDAKDQLVSYRWPGNVRELNNVIMRAVVLTNDEMIDTSHLIFDDLYIADDTRKSSHLIDGFSNNALQFNQADEGLSSSESLSNVVKNSEYQTIMTALKSTRNRDQAAQVLGISTRTLRHKLQRLREDGMAVTRAYAR